MALQRQIKQAVQTWVDKFCPAPNVTEWGIDGDDVFVITEDEKGFTYPTVEVLAQVNFYAQDEVDPYITDADILAALEMIGTDEVFSLTMVGAV